MIELKNLTKSFGEKQVLKDLTWSVPEGRISVIMGPSGGGKTTLLRILLGLEHADSGTVLGLEGKRLSAVFQEDRLCEDADAVTNVTMVSRKVFKETVTQELLQLLPEEAIHKPVKELSGGQRRRVAIVRACAIPSDILIMDEPFTGLDDESREKCIEYIRHKQGSGALVLTTHDTRGLEFGRVIQMV